jgi:predicted molibdopterin-dependent oxidoreductase YjgC
MSARRRAAPSTRSGTRKNYSKFTRTTWNSAASATATGCSSLAARARRRLTDRVAPGVVYTTFYYPETQANVITSYSSDWATNNCPEYKVTSVQVSPSNGPWRWQEDYEKFSRQSRRIASVEAAE